jgi:hypothetical protein
MNDAKIDSIYRQIQNASQVYGVECDEFVNIDFSDINGTAENEVLYIEWQDEVGTDHSVKITEDGLNVAYVDGNTLCLEDTDGLEVRLRLFLMQRVDIKVEWDASQDVPLKKDEIGA